MVINDHPTLLAETIAVGWINGTTDAGEPIRAGICLTIDGRVWVDGVTLPDACRHRIFLPVAGIPVMLDQIHRALIRAIDPRPATDDEVDRGEPETPDTAGGMTVQDGYLDAEGNFHAAAHLCEFNDRCMHDLRCPHIAHCIEVDRDASTD